MRNKKAHAFRSISRNEISKKRTVSSSASKKDSIVGRKDARFKESFVCFSIGLDSITFDSKSICKETSFHRINHDA